jgi:pyruvate,water dikinase
MERCLSGETLNPDEERVQSALVEYLERHGHRAFSLDIAQPTYRDDPRLLLSLAGQGQGQLRATSQERPDSEAIWSKPLIALARRYASLRENQRYYWHKSLAVTRRAYLILGADLYARKLVAAPTDIFYATREQVSRYYGMEIAPEQFASEVASNKTQWEVFARAAKQRGANAYPSFLLGDSPVAQSGIAIQSRQEWQGRGVSAGVARGKVRIVHQPNELGKVGQNEILVTPSTDPAWTPVFARLAGLVMERGGILSHGAVVAREYRLPAVAAIPNLTSELVDGEMIEVDGTTGIVRKLS